MDIHSILSKQAFVLLFHFVLAAVQTEQVINIFQYIKLQYYTVERSSKSTWFDQCTATPVLAQQIHSL